MRSLYLGMVELLVQHGADINDPGSKMCKGITPLHDAVLNMHFEVVKFLVENGARVDMKTAEVS